MPRTASRPSPHAMAAPVCAILLCGALPAQANNGYLLAGYGAESVVMGGADAAWARDGFAVNTNPAGLAQIQGRLADVYVAPFRSWSRHTDQVGNRRETDDIKYNGWIAGAYAQRLGESPVTAAVAMFVQGGSGLAYHELHTPFSNRGEAPRDDVEGVFAIVKVAPALGWEIDEHWRVGAGLGFNYAVEQQEILPRTSTPQFRGFKFRDAHGMGVNLRLGVQYRLNDTFTFGATYSSKTDIPLKHGTYNVNYRGDGLGIVRYGNAKLDGFGIPMEIAGGVAINVTPRLKAALQLKWLDYSEAGEGFTLTVRSPSVVDPRVPTQFRVASPLNLRDQYVKSIGFEYEWNDCTQLYLGFNYAKGPQPDDTVSAIMQLTPTEHYMIGVRRKLGNEWTFLAGAEILPQQQQVNKRTDPIFGAGIRETNTALLLHFMAERRW